MPIENVSDTARWVAVYRAMETERPDAIFRDPYARRLAGARGEEIVRTLPLGRSAAWSMITRTAVLDEMILARVHEGTDLVVNLAAGLDARPWRLALPSTLRWVDVDLPGILTHKTATLRDESPACRYEAVHADLADPTARAAVLARLGAESAGALVVSEGLLIYLAAEDVAGLARDLHAAGGLRWWLTDLANPMLLAFMRRSWGRATDRANAPFRFAPEEGAAFFAPYGWRAAERRSFLEEARRLRREMRGARLFRLLTRLRSARHRERVHTLAQALLMERA